MIGLTYSISAVHTHEYYAERAAALADCADMDRLYLKDPGGLLTPDAVRELAPHFLAAAGRAHGRAAQPLHDRAGAAGLRRGRRRRVSGRAHGRRTAVARDLAARGVQHGPQPRGRRALPRARPRRAGGRVRALRPSSPRAKGLPAGAPREFDAAYYRHQLPGGMVTTTRRMLEELRRPELFDAVLEEVTRVRAEMGYPILVTPVSQFVASQAARNVIDGERWAQRLRRDRALLPRPLRRAAGAGRPGDRRPRAVAAAGAQSSRDLQPITLEGARERFGRRISEEELLLRLTMPAEQVDAMVDNRDRPSSAPAPAARPGRAPLVTLLAGARARAPRSRTSRWSRTARRWSGAVPDRLRLDDVRGFMFDIDGTLVHRGPDGRGRPQPGAVEVLDRIRASGRPLVLFTNGSHVAPETIARGLREDGLPVADDEVLTPVESAITYLRRRLAGRPALLFASEEATELFVARRDPAGRRRGGRARVRGPRRRDRLRLARAGGAGRVARARRC